MEQGRQERLEVALRFIRAIRRKEVERFSRSETPEVLPVVRRTRKKPKKPWPIAETFVGRSILCAFRTPILISSVLEGTPGEKDLHQVNEVNGSGLRYI